MADEVKMCIMHWWNNNDTRKLCIHKTCPSAIFSALNHIHTDLGSNPVSVM